MLFSINEPLAKNLSKDEKEKIQLVLSMIVSAYILYNHDEIKALEMVTRLLKMPKPKTS